MCAAAAGEAGQGPPVEAWLFPAGASRREPARLRLDGAALVLERADGVEERLDPASLTVSSRLGNVPRRITLSDGRVLESSDNDGIDRLLAHHPRHARSARIARLERFHPRLVLLAVVALAVIFAAVRWGVPLAGDAATALVPHAAERQIADSALSFLDDFVFEPTRLSPQRQDEITALFAELAAASDLPPGRLALYFRGGGFIGPNAFALPGGPVVVTDEMVELAPNEDALAGVLAHEIGHVEERHGLKRLVRASAMAATILLLTGDVSSLVEDAVALPALLLDLSYSRGFEREADARAVALLRATGRSPAGMAQLFEMLTAGCRGEDCEISWLSSHPPTRERIEQLRKAAEPAE